MVFFSMIYQEMMLRTEMLGLVFLVNLPIPCLDCNADADRDTSIEYSSAFLREDHPTIHWYFTL